MSATTTQNADGGKTIVGQFYQNGVVTRTETYTTSKDGTTKVEITPTGGPTVTIEGDKGGAITKIDGSSPQAPVPPAGPARTVTARPVKTPDGHLTLEITYLPQSANSQPSGPSSTAPGSQSPGSQIGTVPEDFDFFLTMPPGFEDADPLAVIIHSEEHAAGANEPGGPSFQTPSADHACIVLTGTETVCDVTFTPPVTNETPNAPEDATIYFPTAMEDAFKRDLQLNLSGIAIDRLPTGSIQFERPIVFQIWGSGLGPMPSVNLTLGSSSNGTQTNLFRLTGEDIVWATSTARDVIEAYTATHNQGPSPALVKQILAETNTQPATNAVPVPGSTSTAPNPSAPNNSTSASGPTTPFSNIHPTVTDSPNASVPTNTASGTSTTPTTPQTTASTGITITISSAGQYFDPVTGETEIAVPGDTLPDGWKKMTPPSAPPGITPGNSVSFVPDKGPLLFVNVTSGQTQWLNPPYTAQTGWIQTWPAYSVNIPPLPVSPSTPPPATPPATTPQGNEPTESGKPATRVSTDRFSLRGSDIGGYGSYLCGLDFSATPAANLPPLTSEVANIDYGVGGKLIKRTDSAGALQSNTFCDSKNVLRREETYTYFTYNGKQNLTEKFTSAFDSGRHLQWTLAVKYDWTAGSPATSDFSQFGLHGERTSEEITNYHSWGFESMDLSSLKKKWSYTFTPYKFVATQGSTTPAPASFTPIPTSIGVVCSGNATPGGNYGCTAARSSYTDLFSTVPILRTAKFNLALQTLPDGSPFLQGLEFSIPGQGYVPVTAGGQFSFRLPLNWRPPFELSARLSGIYTGSGPTTTQFDLGNLTPAPTIPSDVFTPQDAANLKHDTELHLIHLWNRAFNLEEELDYEYYTAQNPDWDYVAYLEDELDDTYDDIDDVTSVLPTSDVISLAQGLIDDAKGFQSWLGTQPTLTSDDQADLTDSRHWVTFLGEEALYATFLSAWQMEHPTLEPYWGNPFATQGKLNVFRGPTGYDLFGTHARIGDYRITPFVATPTEYYYMSPTGLTSGRNQFAIENRLFGETSSYLFYVTLTMRAGKYQLHSGESTTYDAVVDVGQGFPTWLSTGSPSFPVDLISSSEISDAQKVMGPPAGTLFTEKITNNSTSTINAKDMSIKFGLPDLSATGSYHVGGTITGIRDGSYSMTDEVRTYAPTWSGLGTVPSSNGSAPSTQAPSSSSWYPAYDMNSGPSSLHNLSSTNCATPTPATTAPATVPGQTTPTTPTTTTGSTAPPGCADNADEELFDQGMHISPSVPVDNNPTTAEMDAAKKRVDDAQAKVGTAHKNLATAQADRGRAFSRGLYKLAEPFQDAWNDMNKRVHRSRLDLDEMRLRYRRNPTSDNLKNIEQAERKNTADIEERDQIKNNILNEFSPEDRAAYQTAQDAVNRAEDAFNDAMAEQHAAENALGELQRAATTK